MGAALCRAHQEPLTPSNENDPPERFLESCDTRTRQPLLREDEMAYLLRYPVFNFEAYENHEPIYGQLADFLGPAEPESSTEHISLPYYLSPGRSS